MNTSFLVKAILVILCFGFIESCVVQLPAEPGSVDVEHYQGAKIIIGTQGGVANLRNETVILDIGFVYYHNNFVNEFKYLKTLTKQQTKSVFRLSRNPNLPHQKFDHPGNMSTFLEVYNKGVIRKSFVWGQPGVDVPPGLDKTYSEIINIIK